MKKRIVFSLVTTLFLLIYFSGMLESFLSFKLKNQGVTSKGSVASKCEGSNWADSFEADNMDIFIVTYIMVGTIYIYMVVQGCRRRVVMAGSNKKLEMALWRSFEGKSRRGEYIGAIRYHFEDGKVQGMRSFNGEKESELLRLLTESQVHVDQSDLVNKAEFDNPQGGNEEKEELAAYIAKEAPQLSLTSNRGQVFGKLILNANQSSFSASWPSAKFDEVRILEVTFAVYDEMQDGAVKEKHYLAAFHDISLIVRYKEAQSTLETHEKMFQELKLLPPIISNIEAMTVLNPAQADNNQPLVRLPSLKSNLPRPSQSDPADSPDQLTKLKNNFDYLRHRLDAVTLAQHLLPLQEDRLTSLSPVSKINLLDLVADTGTLLYSIHPDNNSSLLIQTNDAPEEAVIFHHKLLVQQAVFGLLEHVLCVAEGSRILVSFKSVQNTVEITVKEVSDTIRREKRNEGVSEISLWVVERILRVIGPFSQFKLQSMEHGILS